MRDAGGLRLGIDLGGTKIEGAVLDRSNGKIAGERLPAPQNDYNATIRALAGLAGRLSAGVGAQPPIGIGMPGSLAPRTGLVQNANSTWLNGKPLMADLQAALGGEVRVANDADCFALSEACDGAGAGVRTVFGVILGTGCGGGIVIDGKLLNGPRAIGGEWGHTPLPWPSPAELNHAPCWCGLTGCMETWVSGPALSADYAQCTGRVVSGEAVVAASKAGDCAAADALARHASRLARGLAQVVNIIDPDVIVLGGGLSGLAHLYEALPTLMAPYIFSDDRSVTVRPPRWGDASGVRGAAWLWP